MNYLTYTNSSGETRDYRLVRCHGTTSTTGDVIKEYSAVEDGESLVVYPPSAGYWGFMYKTNREIEAWAMDTDYAIQYFMPSTSQTYEKFTPTGFSVIELNDFFKVRLCLNDDLNSSAMFQNYIYEMLYAYVDPEPNTDSFGLSSDERYAEDFFPYQQNTRTAQPLIISPRMRNSTNSISGIIEYPYHVLIVDDTVDYVSTYNEAVKTDLLQYQHKQFFVGDTVLVPKIPNQCTTSKYLIFAIRARLISGSMYEMGPTSPTFVMPVYLATTTEHFSMTAPEVGLPVATAVRASLTIDEIEEGTGDLVLTAVSYGTAGNDIALTLVDPGAPAATEYVTCINGDIIVYLGTDDPAPGEDYAITSTLDTIYATLAAHTQQEGDTGAVTDIVTLTAPDPGCSTEVVEAMAKTYLTGGVNSSTKASVGKIFYDSTSGTQYVCTAACDGSESNLSKWETSQSLKAVSDSIGTYDSTEFSNRTITELLKTQGFVQKLEAMAAREDDIYEELNNKVLNDPIINPTGVAYASKVIQVLKDETPTTAITLTAIQPGAAGNSLRLAVTTGPVNDVSVNGNDIRIQRTSTLTAIALYNKLVAMSDITDLVIVSIADDISIKGSTDVVEIDPGENFSGGTDGTAALSSTSEEIDAVVANAPEVVSVPTMAQTYATGRLTFPGAANPTEWDTITVGSKTYTFRDALAGGGQENEILICATNVPDDTCLAIQYAINASTGEGHTAFYGTGTTANQDVVATAGDNIVDLTCEGSANAATLLGTPGNAVATTKSAGLTEASFGATHLTGGLDITAANAGKIIIGSSAIYVAKAECTATSNNWETISYDA